MSTTTAPVKKLTFLQTLGKDVKGAFAWLSSPKGKAEIQAVEVGADAITTAINPVAGAALSAFEGLFNTGLNQVVTAETLAAAAGSQDGTGVQKAAYVATAVAPQVSSILQTLGVKSPEATQVQGISTVVASSLANIINAFPPATVPEPTSTAV